MHFRDFGDFPEGRYCIRTRRSFSEDNMRSITDVLRQKETRADKLREEIEKLREAARILENTNETPKSAAAAGSDAAKSWP
jgi:hypothetical protein